MTTKVSPEMLEEGITVGGLIPVGGLTAFAGSVAPAGWLFAYGQSLPRADYPALFMALGTTYGSVDGLTFRLPDLRGRVAVGRDNMGGTPANRVTAAVSGLDAAALGAGGGNQHLHQHSHGVNDTGHSHSAPITTTGGPGGSGGPAVDAPAASFGDTGPATTGVSIQNSGTGASQNVQPSLVLNWIIRAQ